MHTPIVIDKLCIAFSSKTCFENFSTRIVPNTRIGIVGRNGSGKSALLKTLQGALEPTHGTITLPHDVHVGYVPQVIERYASLSGGQRFIKTLNDELAMEPSMLLLDEPTNHLDNKNRRRIMSVLASYYGTLIVASHDTEFLNNTITTLWDIDSETVHVFSGTYEHYMSEKSAKRKSVEAQWGSLKQQHKHTHEVLMKEQQRAKKRKAHGEKKYSGDKLALRSAQGRGQITHSKNKKAIAHTKQSLKEQLSSLRLPEVIVPTFSLSASIKKTGTLMSISEGTVGYEGKDLRVDPIIEKINFCVSARDRVSISGDNGSGKSTLLKAILGKQGIIKTGVWHLPAAHKIEYLDQHYATLVDEESVMESLEKRVPAWDNAQARAHLHNFLFRTNEEVNRQVEKISGGEKARLSLALIASSAPQLLLLDEITNNLDIETKEHMCNILFDYPAAMMVISHDEDFLHRLGITEAYCIKKHTLARAEWH